MLANTLYRDHVSYAVEREVSRQLRGDDSGDLTHDEFDGDTAEICRMIELSGMIGLECNVLQGD